ncbi:hydrogenase maturation nickel metallochaperone HypA [Streptacidiphilus sp. EB129]|uniref:hydrogenase maturation nickel metallochaperone HypA n=1 Tax=Streptacidiphilus sp. EB129 TaxID=3156262 RepID=UPI003518E20B
MSIALAVIEQVAEKAPPGATAECVRLRVGELAGVVPDALSFCFDLACAGTPLSGSRLLVEPVTALARCEPCAREWHPGMPPDLCCPGCGSGTDVVLLSGRELEVSAVHWSGDPACAAVPEER